MGAEHSDPPTGSNSAETYVRDGEHIDMSAEGNRSSVVSIYYHL